MMAYSKVETIPRAHPRSERLLRMAQDLQQTLLRTLPTLIDRLNPGTLGEWNSFQQVLGLVPIIYH
jgi:hypothetical protein